MKGLYIHIPFCRKKCGYCDFVSVPYSAVTAAYYVDSVCSELKGYKGHVFSTVYIGGGTPTVLSKELFRKLLGSVSSFVRDMPVREFTVECNPESVDADKLDILRCSGCNRLSIGLQAVSDKQLLRLGRVHSFADFEKAYSLAREKGFANINIDLMYGLPDQDRRSWRSTLDKALTLKSEHFSLYPLTIEPDTPFYEQSVAVDDDMQSGMYIEAEELLCKAGYDHYEISNWAKPGFESEHNLLYWQNREYAGVGASAASFIDGIRYKNIDDVDEYIKASSLFRIIRQEEEEVGPARLISDKVILGLRCSKGVKLDEDIVIRYGSVIEKFVSEKLLFRENGRISLTRKGRLLANKVMLEFL